MNELLQICEGIRLQVHGSHVLLAVSSSFALHFLHLSLVFLFVKKCLETMQIPQELRHFPFSKIQQILPSSNGWNANSTRNNILSNSEAISTPSRITVIRSFRTIASLHSCKMLYYSRPLLRKKKKLYLDFTITVCDQRTFPIVFVCFSYSLFQFPYWLFLYVSILFRLSSEIIFLSRFLFSFLRHSAPPFE